MTEIPKPTVYRVSTLVIEAANRAEATALLIRCGYRVYRPEVDFEGEDLVVLTPKGELHGVQLKGGAAVDRRRYGNRNLWMLFPSAKYQPDISREWFLVPHDHLFDWVERRHRHTNKWANAWSYPYLNKPLREFLRGWEIRSPADPIGGAQNSN